MTASALEKVMRQAVSDAGLPAKATPHSLRHTNATLQIANGVPLTTVAGNLGHADSATTTKIYAHAIQSAAAASAQMMDDLLNPMAGKRRP
ncbi:tyrosine-type recombinase/integrase [Mediterraneibacter glycyrrhizinilyticus]|uniref:tyrosine-type recombinase/integrase n=1 Tax=Mediterraneibacter glycyrrhizinilyticus TaxID=342942 RepID=UPI0025A384F2|nr:tyrosine-type recombinase/integrase [Mediterraneibacter glycyrrhizinilyticus]MDM8125285.1 tyrosine-type recombinase/integrase [Mediterraneibacter glycyrrhizinilyticus]